MILLMKKSHKGMRKVSNPEIPVEAFYALGGITVLGIGFFIWRATRNIGGIRQTFEQAVAIANEEGGDYAERAASAIRQTPQLSQGSQTNFVSDFNMGQGTSTPVSTSTPSTNGAAETTSTNTQTTSTGTPVSETVNQTQTPAVDQRPPVVPSGEVTQSQRDAILSLASGVSSLRNPRNSYERMLSDRDVADIQRTLIEIFNMYSNNQNVSTSAFADGNIGRMTRALIYSVRTHPIYIEMFGSGTSGESPDMKVYLYEGFLTRLQRFKEELQRRRLNRALTTSTDLGRETLDTSQGYRAGGSATPREGAIIPPAPEWTNFSGSISVKSKKRKL